MPESDYAKKAFDKKMTRIIRILNILNAKRRVSVKSLAKECGVSVRSVQRDIRVLTETGFPLLSPQPGIYALIEGFTLERMRLSDEEGALMCVLGDIVQSFPGKYQDAFKALWYRLLDELPQHAYYVKFPDDALCTEGEGVNIDYIEDAIAASNKLTFLYTKETEERPYTVRPLKIALFAGTWYLIALGNGHDTVLKFKIYNMRELCITQEPFVVDERVERFLENSVNIWFTGSCDIDVELIVDKDLALEFKKKKYIPFQRIAKEYANGQILVEGKMGSEMEVLPTVLSLLPHVIVRKPKTLKSALKKRIEIFAKKIA